VKTVPFGEYESLEDCVAKNKDKEDPAAYCGAIKHAVEEQVADEEVIKAKLLKIQQQISAKEKSNISPEEQAAINALYAERRGLEDALTELTKQKALLSMKERRTPSSYYFFTESIKLDGNVVSGVAIHPKLIWHPESGSDFKAKHDYLKEELKKAAESLKGKPFGEDHLRLLPAPNIMTEGFWDEQQNGVAFKGTVSDDVAQRIRNKEYKGLSVEIDWKKPGKYVMLEKTNGTAPRNFEFTSVHFLRRFPPGDKEAYVKLMEGIVLPIVPPPLDVQIDMIRELFEERLRYLEGQVAAMSQGAVTGAGVGGMTAPAIIIFKEAAEKLVPEIAHMKNVVKTLVKLKESYLAEKQGLDASVTTKKSEFDGALKLLAERLNTPLSSESNAVVTVRKEKVALESRLADAEGKLTRETNAAEQKYRALHKGIMESIPPLHVWNCWTFGPKKLIAEQMRILGIGPNDRR